MTLSRFYQYYRSPIGLLEIGAEPTAIVTLQFVAKKTKKIKTNAVLRKSVRQLKEYFQGTRTVFILPLKLAGTPFQQKVWRALRKIPFGQTVSYKAIAQKIGKPLAARAVGMANNKNKIAIVIPCHRVIGSNRQLVGYASGIWRKKWLLDHEQRS